MAGSPSAETVVDASVAFKWFHPEPGDEAAMRMLDRHERGDVQLVVPSLLGLELVNAAARRWRWSGAEIDALVVRLGRVHLHVADPALEPVGVWASRGLTAHDAAYVAPAEARGCPLVTADAQIVELAPGVARPLGE